MRTVAEYLAKAAEFDELADETFHPELKKSFREVAQSYRKLAKVRERTLEDGGSTPNMLPQ